MSRRMNRTAAKKVPGVFFSTSGRVRAQQRAAQLMLEVQRGQRVALTGTAETQYGHSFVAGGGGAGACTHNRFTPFMRRNIEKATTRKFTTVFMKTP